ncbi:Fic family protein [Wohlfahrtiimonas chitiniclastica]|uniref:Fic family protein n=1 Tax=Wohlfahrtiimonas chitiniclastica TaxID=400946 RepID=UPI0007B69D0C|nr:Fic family protein [Wohlfahrtiimonas chitiniclastica]KZX38221.1 cell filamentation protein Fic [Wohlfahrtiimonas chitiniclastica]
MINENLNKIDALRDQIHSLRPLPELTLSSLQEAMNLEWIYHSNAIEGNTLTLNETKVILEGLTVGQGKTLREHLEVINHQEAIDYIQSLIQSDADLTENIIKETHYLVTKNTVKDAGAYRTQNVVISGASTAPPNHIKVPEAMAELIQWFNSEEFNQYHPVIRAAMFHNEFVKIHPFSDGNGRTGRLLSNLILMQADYLPVIIRAENRLAYYDALDLACRSYDYSMINELFIQEELRSLERYWDIVK